MPAGSDCSPDEQEERTIKGQIGNAEQGAETQWGPTQRLRGGWEYGAKHASGSEREDERFRAEKTESNNNGNNNNSCRELSAYCMWWALYTPELS